MLRYVPTSPTLSRTSNVKVCWICQRCFLYLLRWSRDFYREDYTCCSSPPSSVLQTAIFCLQITTFHFCPFLPRYLPLRSHFPFMEGILPGPLCPHKDAHCTHKHTMYRIMCVHLYTRTSVSGTRCVCVTLKDSLRYGPLSSMLFEIGSHLPSSRLAGLRAFGDSPVPAFYLVVDAGITDACNYTQLNVGSEIWTRVLMIEHQQQNQLSHLPILTPVHLNLGSIDLGRKHVVFVFLGLTYFT